MTTQVGEMRSGRQWTSWLNLFAIVVAVLGVLTLVGASVHAEEPLRRVGGLLAITFAVDGFGYLRAAMRWTGRQRLFASSRFASSAPRTARACCRTASTAACDGAISAGRGVDHPDAVTVPRHSPTDVRRSPG